MDVAATATAAYLVDEPREEGVEQTRLLAGEVEALRKRLGLSYEGVAYTLGLSRMSIYTWRKGRACVPPYKRQRYRSQVRKIAEIAATHDWDRATVNLETKGERDEYMESLLTDGGYLGNKTAGVVV